MTFDAREHSIAQGQPVRLYAFARGVMRWLYCSVDRDIPISTQIYRAVRGGISDPGVRITGDARSDRLEITGPADISVAQLWRSGQPSNEVGLTVYDMHYGDTDPVFAWAGRVSSVNWPALDRCKIVCVSRDAELAEPGLTDPYSRTCTAVLGDPRCGVDLNPLRVDAQIQSIDGIAVYSADVTGYPDGWFTGGYIEWPIGSGEFDRRFIEAHSSTQLKLLGGTAGVPVSGSLRVYPGCDFLFGTCRDKFGNGDRFRGIPNLEGRSPFDGNAVW